MDAQREMTLDEWCEQLHPAHRVRKELATLRAHIEGLEAELNARINQQVSEGVRGKLITAQSKLDDAEWRAICGMFIEAENVQRGQRQRAESAEARVRELEAKVEELDGLILQNGELDGPWW